MVFGAEPVEKKATYYTIKEATFRVKTHKDDPEAQARTYTNPKTKQDGVAYERVFKALFGRIEDIKFTENSLDDGTVLRSININLGDSEDGTANIISMPIDSRYTADFLKRLPKIDLTKEVRLMPYDIEDNGPRKVGISITQRDDNEQFTIKIPADFFTKVEEKNGEKIYTNLHGFPEATEEDASDWPFYFKKVEKFLINYTKENILPKFQKDSKPTDRMLEALEEIFPEGSINPDSIPF